MLRQQPQVARLIARNLPDVLHRIAGVRDERLRGRIAQDAMGDFYLHQNARKVKHESELVELLQQMW